MSQFDEFRRSRTLKGGTSENTESSVEARQRFGRTVFEELLKLVAPPREPCAEMITFKIGASVTEGASMQAGRDQTTSGNPLLLQAKGQRCREPAGRPAGRPAHWRGAEDSGAAEESQ